MRVVLADPPDSAAARAAVTALRDDLDGVDGAAVAVGGPTAQDIDVSDASLRDALVVTPAALAVVLIILELLLRDVVGPVVLLGTVVLSYLAARGGGGLVMRLMGFDAVDVSLPLAAFVFLVALGILLDTFVVRALLVLELAIDLGRRFWLPSRRGRLGAMRKDAVAERSSVSR